MSVSVSLRTAGQKVSNVIPAELYKDLYRSFGLDTNTVIKDFLYTKSLNKLVHKTTGMKYAEISLLSNSEKESIIEQHAVKQIAD